MKTCTKCKIEKDEKEFYKEKLKKDGLMHDCKKCSKESAIRWAKTHPEQARERSRRWRKNNPDDYALHTKYIMQKQKEYIQGWKDFFRNSGRDFCSICGYNKCFAAIDFHELIPRLGKITPSDFIRTRPPSEKNVKITENWITLCANCHRELHYNAKN
jgi:hypothetical protein